MRVIDKTVQPNPNYFYEEMFLTLAINVDWLRGRLKKEQRNKIVAELGNELLDLIGDAVE